MNKKKLVFLVAIVAIGFVVVRFTTSDRQVDFSTDVKPILNKKCITCHGGVRAKAGFSVLFREEALANTESGKPAIVPGDPDASELMRRISIDDPEERMPYKHEPLSKEEISIFRKWIKQGARWGDHWAYVPVKPQTVPDVESPWIINDVDKFIYQKLEEQEIEPSALADKATILRRVSLDLIGMYPSKETANKFLTSNDPKAYETLVDSLLASKHFGEKWTSMWLDLARYADSKGYEADHERQIWEYRDWLIKAFNDDKPYDVFLTEQLAGDLLPNPTDAQYVATAFSRNSMNNDEGGTDNEEFRVAAVIDRVNTTWEALMGTTFGCVQCHSHPYDPFKHDEYYSFLAYFNNTRDEDQPPEFPVYKLFNDTLKQQLNKLVSWVKENSSEEDAKEIKLFLQTSQPAVYGSSTDSIKNGFISGNNGPLALHHNGSFMLKKINMDGRNQVIFRYFVLQNGATISAHLDSPNGPVIGKWNVPKTKGTQLGTFEVKTDNGIHDIYFTYENRAFAHDEEQDRIYIEFVALTKDLPAKGTPAYAANKKIYWKLLETPQDNVPVMVENPKDFHRKTFVFEKGNRFTPGKEVQPGVPNSLAAAMPKDAPKNRLGMAMWLTDQKNPLVSRTAVNRFWEQLFGTGLVETLEDMGTQGTLPTHQELLDHYSWKMMNDYKWSMKRLIKEFVMSATYRQDSKVRDDLNEKDPNNKYYARAPRLRLHAEQVRDQALCVSGMLSDKMYGPGVMPWQPAGIWMNPYNSESWKTSEGEDQYRRSVYTYVKRTAGYPSAITFDGSQRIVCTPRRIRTNTPLQALVTLNDSVYVDLAGHFSSRMAKEGGNDVKSQIAKGYEMMLYKPIPQQKLDVFLNLYEKAVAEFKTSDSAAVAFTKTVGKTKETPEKAALKLVANAMLNIDEVITKN
ncbi:MAG: DUF1549 domain-containing protein [Chitinophagaceae bacterium]|nr:DUF1549 domain-containing protein [Chitinophagaceae bacterium]